MGLEQVCESRMDLNASGSKQTRMGMGQNTYGSAEGVLVSALLRQGEEYSPVDP
jgi:hypothetical protein